MFDEERVRANLADALLAYDEPFGDSSSLAVHLLSRQVARDFKVAIGGDGGDEVFAGYKKYMVVHLRRPFAASPRLRNALGTTLTQISRLGTGIHAPRAWREVVRRINRVGMSLDGSDADVYWQFNQWVPLAKTAALMRKRTTAARFVDEAQGRFNRAVGSELQKTLAADLGSVLSNDMLVKVDRASMACGLEARVPFLDHRLVEYAVGLPEYLTVGPGREPFRGKRVLRALHERRFGRSLARRKKQGFSVPVRTWLQGPLSAACDALFDKRRLDRFEILSAEQLSDGRHRQWLTDEEPYIVWYAFALSAWCEAVLGDGPDALREIIARATRDACGAPAHSTRLLPA
jgi:asparagine synthase (glutamine-hydrolysing)